MDTLEKDFSLADVKTLRRLTSILNGGELTQEEFVKAFEQVVAIVLNIEQKIIANNAAERAELVTTASTQNDTNQTAFDKLLKQSKQTIADALLALTTSVDARVATMEMTVSQLEDGKDADEELMLARLKAMIPTVEDILKFLPEAGKDIRNALELLQGKERLNMSAIDGLQEAIDLANKTGKPVRFVGGARGIYVYISGVKKGIMNSFNFAGGTGVSIAYSKVNGLDTLTINATGAGVTVETPPEPVNAVTTVFTVSAKPKWIVSDGTTYYENSGYTYAALQVTLDIAPSSFIRAII